MNKRYPFSFMSVQLIIGMLILLTVGCSSCSTKPKTGAIKGQVILVNDTGDPSQDAMDCSGVTVALYELAELDTTLVRINCEYPGTGVLISQETEFDHRSDDPLKVTTTVDDGHFELGSIDPGSYNIVFLKEDWGIKYLHNIHVEEGQALNIGDTQLFPMQEYSSSVIGDITLKTDHTYYIPEDASFINSVTIEPRANIYVNAGCAVRFYGNVATPDVSDLSEAWRYTSAKELYSTARVDIGSEDYCGQLQFYGNEVSLENGIFRHFNYIEIIGENCNAANMYFSRCVSGIVSSGSNLIANNLTIAHGSGDGINCQSSSTISMQITDSVLMDMNHAVFYSSLGTYDISNNYFWNSEIALRMQYGTGSITHNVFNGNNLDISFYNVTTTVDISYNDFLDSGYYTIRPWYEAIVNYNNFYRTENYYIIIWNPDLHNNSFVTADLDARNNYWVKSNIDDYILDANDNDDHPDEPCPYYIIYNPRRNSPVPDAGIQ